MKARPSSLEAPLASTSVGAEASVEEALRWALPADVRATPLPSTALQPAAKASPERIVFADDNRP